MRKQARLAETVGSAESAAGKERAEAEVEVEVERHKAMEEESSVGLQAADRTVVGYSQLGEGVYPFAGLVAVDLMASA